MRTKALVLGAALLVAPFSQALADKDIGCGWGTMVWKGQSGLAPKVLGATTNGTFGNQTFGITSGTGGCSSAGVVTADARVSMFASANLDRLMGDMAAGRGESLETLAHLMNVSEPDRGAFYGLTKSHFGDLFPSDQVTAGDMLTNLGNLMASDPSLSKYVL